MSARLTLHLEATSTLLQCIEPVDHSIIDISDSTFNYLAEHIMPLSIPRTLNFASYSAYAPLSRCGCFPGASIIALCRIHWRFNECDRANLSSSTIMCWQRGFRTVYCLENCCTPYFHLSSLAIVPSDLGTHLNSAWIPLWITPPSGCCTPPRTWFQTCRRFELPHPRSELSHVQFCSRRVHR